MLHIGRGSEPPPLLSTEPLAMASRILARSKALALAAAVSRALSSLPRYPADPSPLGLGKVLGYESTSHLSGTQLLPRWFSTAASNGSPMQRPQISETYKSGAAVEQSEGDTPKVVAFSPLEAATAKPRRGPLSRLSSRVSKTELATQVTFYMVPAMLLASTNSLSTSVLVGAVFHQVYMFHKEILLDYVHHDITRKWALIYFKILLLVMAKDTITYFNYF